MATNGLSEVIQHLRSTVYSHDDAGLTDAQLLRDYIRCGDGSALTILVGRHAPMVWGVCRRLLSHQDAEDAFQATFLVLVRKATTIRPREMVGNWLYGVAHQTALKARSTLAKRGARERHVLDIPEPAMAETGLRRDLQPFLDEELSHLPDKYRAAIVLCDLEGKTRKEAARQLGVPEGTVASRLATARKKLANRLARRGLVLSGVALGSMLAENNASASVPVSVLLCVIKAVSALAAGQWSAAGTLPAKVTALSERVVKTMLLRKLTKVLLAAALFAVGSLAISYGVLALGQSAVPGAPIASRPGGISPSKQAGAPSAPKPATTGEETIESIIAKLERKGAKFKRDDKLPGKPIVQADMTLLFGDTLSVEDVKLLTRFPEISDLRLGGRGVGDEALKEIVSLKKIKVLNLGGAKITDAGLNELHKLPGLEDLWLAGTPITNDGLKALAKIKTLKIVGFYNTEVGDAGIKALHGLETLEELTLTKTRITDGGLKHLAAFPKLHSLRAGELRLTDAGMKALRQLSQLTFLYLHDTDITDRGVKELANLVNLRTLNLAATSITDDGVAALAGLKKLQTLNLMMTKITDRSLESLSRLPQLWGLELSHTKITDAAIPVLARMKRLDNLALDGTGVTKTGADELRKQLPKCRIYWR
jgi:RNA polymerase sigma factor (sigma-70 family)